MSDNVTTRINSVLKAGAEYRSLSGTYISQETIMQGRLPRTRTLKPTTIYEVSDPETGFTGTYMMAWDSIRSPQNNGDLIKFNLGSFSKLVQGDELDNAPEGKAYIFPNVWALRFRKPMLVEKAAAERFVATGAWSYTPCAKILVKPTQD